MVAARRLIGEKARKAYNKGMSITILLHSSKTMRLAAEHSARQPHFMDKAKELHTYLQTLSTAQLSRTMHTSQKLAEQTKNLIATWDTNPQTAAIDSFIGDIYSGLRAGEFTKDDRHYADQTLWILSGLYGFIRPLDGIRPYRLEMGYKLPDERYTNLYNFWGDSIARQLPKGGYVINASSVEYSRVITEYIEPARIITPEFLTYDPTTDQPTFKAVHAKIARGAFARWLIIHRVVDPAKFHEFHDLGYSFDQKLSTPHSPTFVCKTFGGIGLSIRLG